MKTFEQFLNDRGDDPAMIPCEGWIDGNEYKAIQLESYKAGLKAAAEISHNIVHAGFPSVKFEIEKAILALHDTITELPKRKDRNDPRRAQSMG